MSNTTISHTAQTGTPGQCFVAQLFDSYGKSIASLDSTEDPATATETARRLAACWNACIGLDTESLERSDVLSSLNAKIRNLDVQNANLLIELRRVNSAHILAALNTAMAEHHLHALLNQRRTATQMLDAERAAREWLENIGSEPS